MTTPSVTWAIHLFAIAPALEVIADWIDELAHYMEDVSVEIVGFDNGSSDYNKHIYLVVIPGNGENVGDEYVQLYRNEDGEARIRPVEADEDMQDVLYPYGLDWIDGEVFNCPQDWYSSAGRDYDHELRMVFGPEAVAIVREEIAREEAELEARKAAALAVAA